MARTYREFLDLVRSWSNRDTEVLTDSIISDCIKYAADKAYRTLRVPPLEHTVTYSAAELQANTVASNNRISSVTEVCIPSDLIEFMYIRGLDAQGRTTRMFNEKADIRTFYDLYAEKYNDFAFWSRHGNNILLAPGFRNTGTNFGSTGVGNEECIELHYYRRLPAFYARYEPTIANARLNLLTEVTMANPLPMGVSGTPENPDGNTAIPTVMLTRTVDPVTMAVTWTEGGTTEYYGNLVPNWLRDENERVVLMGALAEAFFYLQENEESQKYAALFQAEIAELNKEDQMRHTSGGNVQVNFNGRGLI